MKRSVELCRLIANLLWITPAILSAKTNGDDDGGHFDFFYFVQQWPGASCGQCCYPTTGKPAADFSIYGLWPNYADGSYPSNCDPDNSFDDSKIEDLESRLRKEWPPFWCPSSDGLSLWSHEWNKHGTCSENMLNQHDYFQAALNLKNKTSLLQALKVAGIEPNDKFYNLEHMKHAIKEATRFKPSIQCNRDDDRNSQIYQVYMCVDTSGKNLIDCHVSPRGKCGFRVKFSKF